MIGAASVLAPVFVQVALTFLLLLWSGTLRVRAVRSGVVRGRDIALRQANWPAGIAQINNAYQNQLELPILFYVATLLTLHGASATTAASVAEALESLDRVTPDVVVSDINMPGEDGLVFVDRLRALPTERGGKVPVIALTGFADREDVDELLARGFQEVVLKPAETGELLGAIQRVLAPPE